MRQIISFLVVIALSAAAVPAFPQDAEPVQAAAVEPAEPAIVVRGEAWLTMQEPAIRVTYRTEEPGEEGERLLEEVAVILEEYAIEDSVRATSPQIISSSGGGGSVGGGSKDANAARPRAYRVERGIVAEITPDLFDEACEAVEDATGLEPFDLSRVVWLDAEEKQRQAISEATEQAMLRAAAVLEALGLDADDAAALRCEVHVWVDAFGDTPSAHAAVKLYVSIPSPDNDDE